MNYTISSEWQSVASLVGATYDRSKIYRIHNNVTAPLLLAYTESADPTSTASGSIAPSYVDIYEDAGITVSLRLIATSNDTTSLPGFAYTVDITEVE